MWPQVSTFLRSSCTLSPKTLHSPEGTRRYPPVTRGRVFPKAHAPSWLQEEACALAVSSASVELPARRSRTRWFPQFRSLRSSSSADTQPWSSAWPTAPSAIVT